MPCPISPTAAVQPAPACAAVRRLLVVEDDPDITELLGLHLADLPAELSFARDGRQGLGLAMSRGPWDAMVLDLGLPGLNGLDLCREIRAQAGDVPILMLTARAAESDRVRGLELGADDYVTKPFSVLELVARLRALMRRSAMGRAGSVAASAVAPVAAGGLRMDRQQRRAWLHGDELPLTPREFDLLWHFASHPGIVFTRDALLDSVWGHGHDGYDHTVNTHINRLRNKLGDSRRSGRFIHTVWGVGYRFEAPP